MSDLEYAIIAAALVGFAIGTAFGFFAGRARIREAVLRHRSRYRRLRASDPIPSRIDRHGRARYRRVGTTK